MIWADLVPWNEYWWSIIIVTSVTDGAWTFSEFGIVFLMSHIGFGKYRIKESLKYAGVIAFISTILRCLAKLYGIPKNFSYPGSILVAQYGLKIFLFIALLHNVFNLSNYDYHTRKRKEKYAYQYRNRNINGNASVNINMNKKRNKNKHKNKNKNNTKNKNKHQNELTNNLLAGSRVSNPNSVGNKEKNMKNKNNRGVANRSRSTTLNQMFEKGDSGLIGDGFSMRNRSLAILIVYYVALNIFYEIFLILQQISYDKLSFLYSSSATSTTETVLYLCSYDIISLVRALSEWFIIYQILLIDSKFWRLIGNQIFLIDNNSNNSTNNLPKNVSHKGSLNWYVLVFIFVFVCDCVIG